MNHNSIMIIFIGILILCLPAMLPNQMIKTSNKVLLFATTTVSAIVLIMLAVLIPLIYRYR